MMRTAEYIGAKGSELIPSDGGDSQQQPDDMLEYLRVSPQEADAEELADAYRDAVGEIFSACREWHPRERTAIDEEGTAIELHLPENYKRSCVPELSKVAEEFVYWRLLEHWLGIVAPVRVEWCVANASRSLQKFGLLLYSRERPSRRSKN
jgi:hypothetical protein